MGRTPKVTSLAQYTKLNEGVMGTFPKKTAIDVAGESLTPVEFQARIQARVDKAAVTENAKTAYHQAVEDEVLAEEDASKLRDGMQGVVQGKFGKTSKKLLDFGFKPRKARKVSAATAAHSVEQAKETRLKNGTGGKGKTPGAQAPTGEVAQAVAAAPAAPVVPAVTNGTGGRTTP